MSGKLRDKPSSTLVASRDTLLRKADDLVQPELLDEAHTLVKALREAASMERNEKRDRTLIRCADREAGLLRRTALETARHLPPNPRNGFDWQSKFGRLGGPAADRKSCIGTRGREMRRRKRS
jgi:hypothetical protein